MDWFIDIFVSQGSQDYPWVRDTTLNAMYPVSVSVPPIYNKGNNFEYTPPFVKATPLSKLQ